MASDAGAGGLPVVTILVVGGLLWLAWSWAGGRRRSRSRASSGAGSGGGWRWAPSADVGLDRRSAPAGATLAALASTQVVALLSGYAGSEAHPAFFVGGLVVAVGFVLAPAVTAAGVGATATVALVLEQLGVGPCDAISSGTADLAWLVATITAVTVVLVTQRVVRPVAAAPRAAAAALPFLSGRGARSYRTGSLGASLLTAFAVVELMGLAGDPAVVEEYHALGQPWLLVVALVLAGALAVSLAVLPAFTLSVLGAGTAVAVLVLLPLRDSCLDVTAFVVTGLAFAAVTLIARRFT